MANLNKVFLMGNLTADPELRYTPKGTAVTDIRLAINRYYAGDNSERQEETTFVDVTLWNRQAEVAGNYLSKGRGVFVEGRLQLDSWEDKASGQKRTKLRVIGENIQLFPRGGEVHKTMCRPILASDQTHAFLLNGKALFLYTIHLVNTHPIWPISTKSS